MKRLALGVAALTAPGCSQEPAPAPPAATQGVTASIADAIARGDEAALLRITLGSIYTRLTIEARRNGAVRMSASELIALTRGCRPEGPIEPSGPNPAEAGSVEIRCEGRPSAENSCEDVGYGLLVKPQAGYARIEVWPAGGWSRARCGEPRPPPPAPPLPRVPRTPNNG